MQDSGGGPGNPFDKYKLTPESLTGQGTFQDTGRQSSGPGEMLDSFIGAPVRTAVDEVMKGSFNGLGGYTDPKDHFANQLVDEAHKGNVSWDAVKRIFHQIGADPEHAPTGYDIVSRAGVENPWLGAFLSTALDVGAQAPVALHIPPGVIGEIRGVKHLGKLADAIEAFAERSKLPPSTETKIAQMHGQTGEVRDAMPPLLNRAAKEHKVAESREITMQEAGEGINKGTFGHNYNSYDYWPRSAVESTGERSGRPVVDPDYAKIPQPLGSLGDAAYKAGPHELIPGEKRSLHGGPAGDVFEKTDNFGNTEYFVQDKSGNVKAFKNMDAADDYYSSLYRDNSVEGLRNKDIVKVTSDNFEGYTTADAYRELKLQMSSGDFGAHSVERVDKVPKGEKLHSFEDLFGPKKYAHGGLVGYAHGGFTGPGITAFPQHMPMPSDAEVQAFLGNTQDSGATADLPSEAEVNAWLNKDKAKKQLDTPLGYAAAGIAGALDSATLGLSNAVLTKSGLVNPEALKLLKETNPGMYGLGEIGGLFAPGGAAKLIGKAGKATYEGMKGLEAVKAIDKLGKAGKALTDIGAFTAGSAVEGALFSGVQNSVNEFALGDPTLNAEKVMANFGHGALYGGAFGALLKTAAVGAPPSLRAAKDGIKWVKDKVAGTGLGEESLVSRGLDILDDSGKLSDAFMNRAKKMGPEEQQQLVQDVTSGLNTVKNNLHTAEKDLNSVLRPAERDALIETANPKRVIEATDSVIHSINTAVDHMKANSGEYSASAISKLERWRTQIANNLKNKTPGSRFDLLKDFKQDMERWGKGFQSETKAETKKMIDGITGNVREILHNPDIFGMAGSSEAAHNELLSQLYEFVAPKIGQRSGPRTALQKEFQKYFLNASGEFDAGKLKKFLKISGTPEGSRASELLDAWFDIQQKLPDHFENTLANVPNDLWDKSKLDGIMKTLTNTQGDIGLAQTQYQDALLHSKGDKLGLRELLLGGIGVSHPALGAVGLAVDVASRPIEYMNKLAEVERVIGQADKAMSKAAKGVFKPVLKGLGKTKGLVGSEFGEKEIDSHKKMRDDLSQFNNNVAFAVEKLAKATEHLTDVAPTMAEGLQGTIMRANQLLQSKLPPTVSASPFDPDPDPSRFEVSNFNRYRHVVEDPFVAFDQIREGTIGPETVETLNIVYPGLYQTMKGHLLDVMTDKLAKKEEIPYQLKQSISFFFDQPLDRSLSPQSILQNQMAMVSHQLQQPNPGAQKPNKKGMQEMTVADRTGVQRSREDA